METLWPRTDPLLAEVLEPSRSTGTGRGSAPARPSPFRLRGLAQPVASRRDPPRRLVALLEGWLRALVIWALARAAAAVRTERPLGHHHPDPGARGTPDFARVSRPGLEARRPAPARRLGAPHHERVPCPTRVFRRPEESPGSPVHSRDRLHTTMREGRAQHLRPMRMARWCAAAGAADHGADGTVAAPAPPAPARPPRPQTQRATTRD